MENINYKEQYPNHKWYEIEWENADRSNLLGLPKKTQKELKSSVNKLNDILYKVRYFRNKGINIIPDGYKEYADMKCNHFYGSKQNAEIATTTLEETYALDQLKAEVYWEENVFGQIFASVTSPLEKWKWDIKQYGIKPARNPIKFSRSFANPDFTQVTITDQKNTGIGLYGAYAISKAQLMQSEGQFFDLEMTVALETSRYLGRAMNEHIANGTTTTLGIPMDDDGSGNSTLYTGFLNNASNQDFTVSTPSTYGNIMKGTRAALADLKTCRAPGIIIAIMSAGMVSQMEQNYPTYGHGNYTEMDEWKRQFIDRGVIDQLWVSEKCLGSAVATTSTQYFYLLKVGERHMDRKVCLPLQTWSNLNKAYQEDIKETMVVGDIIRFKLRPDTTTNAFPVTVENTLTTNDIGYLEEKRVF